MFALRIIAVLGLARLAVASCSRAMLQDAADSYIAAQAVGKSSLLTPLAANVAYTENRVSKNLDAGVLAAPLRIDHNRSSLDTTQCATYTELISTQSNDPTVLGWQMRFGNVSSGGGNGTLPLQITRIDSIVAHKGDWLFNATATLAYASQEDWGVIPLASRDTRITIQAAADAYLDSFDNSSIKVPWGSQCSRLEGGSYFTPCSLGIPSGVVLTDRKYVIDETFGAVDVMLSFGGANGLPDSHEFRVEDGKLRYIHAITYMGGNHSGM
jgi:hypothetical protein